MPLRLPDRALSKRDQRRAQLCEQVMAAVEQQLDEGVSLGELGIDRLVKAAGVSRSSFYVYFEDRGDLLRQWFASVVDEIVAAIQPWWQLGPEVERADVREVLGGVVRAYRPHARLMAATYDAATHDPALTAMTDALVASSERSLRKHIRAGQAGGWVEPSLDAEHVAAQLTWMAERTFHRVLPSAGAAATEQLADAYTDIVFRTLYVTR